MIEPVRKSVLVPCNQETAFTIFIGKVETWWPLDRHSISAMSGKSAKRVSIEPHEGGKIVEIAFDDEIHLWGAVTRYEPFSALELDWHVNSTPDKATQVIIAFHDDGDGQTRVDLEHRNWENLGDNAAETRDGYNQGWVGVFETAFADACSKA